MAAVLLTVDSMAIIMHRVREEYRNDKTVKAAVKTAYKRSILSILEIDCVLAVLSLLMFFICMMLSRYLTNSIIRPIEKLAGDIDNSSSFIWRFLSLRKRAKSSSNSKGRRNK